MKHNLLTCAIGMAIVATALHPIAAIAGDSAPLKLSSEASIKGTQTVVVGAFNVGFIFSSIDNTKATGGMIGAFGGTTKAKSELVGVSPAMMQAITDAAYADFKEQLAARGFTVADAAAHVRACRLPAREDDAGAL